MWGSEVSGLNPSRFRAVRPRASGRDLINVGAFYSWNRVVLRFLIIFIV